MADNTTIIVKKSTRAILEELKQHPRETWEDVVRRLAENAQAATQERRSA